MKSAPICTRVARGTPMLCALTAVLLASSCAIRSPTSDATANASAEQQAPADPALQTLAELWPLSSRLYRTTGGAIYLGNLDARIATLRTSGQSNQPGVRERLAGALYHRYKLLGRLADAEEALTLLGEPATDAELSSELRILTAIVWSGFHRFAAAKAQLAAIPDAARGDDYRRVAADIDVALGNYSAIADDFAQSSQPVGDFYELAHRADLRLLQGDLAGAEQQFRAAQSLYRDVSPVPLAWLHSQMGIALLRFGQIAEARRFFTAAVDRLPGYVLAEEHLAECEHRLGELDAARQRYLRVVAQTDNPEFMAALAQVEAARGDSGAAADWARRSRERYASLLREHADAFAYHAAEFYLDQGDSERALQLARDNRELRADIGSELLLARSAAAAGQLAMACTAWQRAQASGLQPPELAELSALQLDCD